MPPALRNKASSNRGEDARLLKQVRGLLNRLAESNMQSIVTQVPWGMKPVILMYMYLVIVMKACHIDVRVVCRNCVSYVVFAHYVSCSGCAFAPGSSRPMPRALNEPVLNKC